MFVDASALVAILAGESDAEELTGRIEQADRVTTSPIAVFETVAALLRRKRANTDDVAVEVRSYLQKARIDVAPVTAEIGYLAAHAHAMLGKRSGHPARLNLGDCFAYAMAKQDRLPLLYKGEDFAHTDLA